MSFLECSPSHAATTRDATSCSALLSSFDRTVDRCYVLLSSAAASSEFPVTNCSTADPSVVTDVYSDVALVACSAMSDLSGQVSGLRLVPDVGSSMGCHGSASIHGAKGLLSPVDPVNDTKFLTTKRVVGGDIPEVTLVRSSDHLEFVSAVVAGVLFWNASQRSRKKASAELISYAKSLPKKSLKRFLPEFEQIAVFCMSADLNVLFAFAATLPGCARTVGFECNFFGDDHDDADEIDDYDHRFVVDECADEHFLDDDKFLDDCDDADVDADVDEMCNW